MTPTRSLSQRVVAWAVVGLVLALVLVGVGTAGLLVVRAQQALDAALLAAAQAEAHPWAEERWRAEHTETLVEVRRWRAGDPLITADEVARAMVDERPRWATRDGKRVLWLTIEPQDAPPGPDGDARDHPHAVLVATAPQVRATRVVGPFLLSYGGVAALTAGLLGLVLGGALHRALRPLREAVDALDALGGSRLDARLDRGGPTEVDRVIAAANRLLERLEASASAQRRFVADAAHELRTPMTALVGELDLALRRPREADALRDALVRSRERARRLERLVEALLGLARVDTGQARGEGSREHLSGLVLAAVADERQALSAAGCALQVVAGRDVEVVVTVDLVVAAVANLLRNAVAHAPGAPVEVAWGGTDDGAWVEVRDRGPGPGDAPEALFERFHRGSVARPGLGLGLPLAREIARAHGGDLVLAARDGGGAVARLTLPGVRGMSSD